MRKLLLLLAVLLMLMPVAYAEPAITQPVPLNITQLEALKARFLNITLLDTPTFQEETFEWECDGGILAEIDDDPFECSWVYGEEPNSNYIKIMRTTDTNWGLFAAFWDGPNVGIGSSGWNSIMRYYTMPGLTPAGRYISWKHKQVGTTSAVQYYWILLYDSQSDYAYSDPVYVSDSKWNYKALGDDTENGWKYMRTKDLDQWTPVTVVDGFDWNDVQYIQIERMWNNDPTTDADDIMDDVFLVEDLPPEPIKNLNVDSKSTTWVLLNFDTWEADGDFDFYEMQYKESSSSTWGGTQIEVYEWNSMFVVSGLSPGTSYDFRVRVHADNGDVSTWVYANATTDWGTVPLIDDTPTYVDLSSGERKFSFDISSNRWAVVGLRMLNDDDDDVYVYDNFDFTGFKKSSIQSGGSPDFVVVNGHRKGSDTDYALVNHWSGSGYSTRIEAQGSSTTEISPGTSVSRTIDNDEVNDMYESNFEAGKEYVITLTRQSGSADLDLYLYSEDLEYANIAEATITSDNDAGGVDEVITYTPSTTGYVGIVVVHDGTSESASDYADYRISVDQNRPPSPPATAFYSRLWSHRCFCHTRYSVKLLWRRRSGWRCGLLYNLL